MQGMVSVLAALFVVLTSEIISANLRLKDLHLFPVVCILAASSCAEQCRPGVTLIPTWSNPVFVLLVFFTLYTLACLRKY